MGQLDHQLGFANESTYGTGVTVTRFFEYDSENIADDARRTEGDPLRVGSPVQRNDRFTPYYGGASGSITMGVLTKGFGYFLQHMLGSVATSGPTDSKYTHTGTLGALYGKFFTAQLNRPFHPAGTNQAITFHGGKVTEWTLSNSVEERLMLELGVDFAGQTTATALATASYPASMDDFTWAGGVVTIGGSQFDVSNISIRGNNGQDTDRRRIRANTTKKEPTSGRRTVEFSLAGDFESLAQRDRVLATTRSGALAQIVATWTGPTLIGTSSYPTVVVTIPAARFDTFSGASEGTEGIQQELGGVGLWDGTNSAVTIAYGTADATP